MAKPPTAHSDPVAAVEEIDPEAWMETVDAGGGRLVSSSYLQRIRVQDWPSYYVTNRSDVDFVVLLPDGLAAASVSSHLWRSSSSAT